MPFVTASQLKEFERLIENERVFLNWLTQLKAHLASDKFQGTEEVRIACAKHSGATGPVLCQYCYTTSNRKDWMATADIQAWLNVLNNQLQ